MMSQKLAQCWCPATEPRSLLASHTRLGPYFSYTPNALRKLCSKNKQPLHFRMSSYKQLIKAQTHLVTRECFSWCACQHHPLSSDADISEDTCKPSSKGTLPVTIYSPSTDITFMTYYSFPDPSSWKILLFQGNYILPLSPPLELTMSLPPFCWHDSSTSTSVVLINETNSRKMFSMCI